MELIIAELSRYVLIILFAFYTLFSFRAFSRKTEEGKNAVWHAQRTITVLILLLCGSILIMETKELRYLVLLGLELAFYVFFVKIYQVFYRGLSKLVLNNMMICMMIGLVMLGRLKYEYAIRQLVMAAAAMAVCLLVPLFIERFTIWEKLSWQYALAGILFLMLVFVIGVEKYGAKNWISLGGIDIQPSEFVKIIYVFFIAGALSKFRDFKHIVVISAIAAVHVLILVASTDLGTAFVFFMAYVVVIYVATRKARYPLLGLAGMSAACVVAYFLFSHVRNRVALWQDPIGNWDISSQLAQGLFGMCSGGWFGTGLFEGRPDIIPVATKDFIFCAICEEMGIIFGICLILLCMSTFLLIINISMKMSKRFYKLIAMGLGTEYATQVFLTIGGTIKFIPMTGITLPLVSYGGSSMFSTVLMLSIIQGLYILREDEGEELEKRRNKKKRNQQKNDPGAKKKRRPDEETERRKKSGGRNDGQGTRQKYREQPDEFERRIEEQTENSLHW